MSGNVRCQQIAVLLAHLREGHRGGGCIGVLGTPHKGVGGVHFLCSSISLRVCTRHCTVQYIPALAALHHCTVSMCHTKDRR